MYIAQFLLIFVSGQKLCFNAICVCVFIKGIPGRDGKDGLPGGIGLKVCTDLVLLTVKKKTEHVYWLH